MPGRIRLIESARDVAGGFSGHDLKRSREFVGPPGSVCWPGGHTCPVARRGARGSAVRSAGQAVGGLRMASRASCGRAA